MAEIGDETGDGSERHDSSLDSRGTRRSRRRDGRRQSAKAMIKTKFGDMEIAFFPDKAPKHVENFIKLAKSGLLQRNHFSSRDSRFHDPRG